MRSLFLLTTVIIWLALGWMHSISQQVLEDDKAAIAESEIVQAESNKEADFSEKLTDQIEEPRIPIRLDTSKQIQLTEEWLEYKEELIESLKEDEILQITGKYTEDEEYNGTLENLGMARAEEIRQNLGLASEKVQLRGILDTDTVDNETVSEVISFRNIIVNNSIDESIENRTIIRFPSNSTNKLNDEVVEEYLDKLIRRITKSGEHAKLTGFSDSDGSVEHNLSLGQRRADVIKDYLVSKGVEDSRVITLSEGEGSPIASNDTEEGKAKNRRTELEIIN
jgi:outer membrane protein OmpA-like peptidoglycan-associated protein